MTDKQIIIDGVDVNALYSDQIACMNRYEVANLFIKTVERLVTKEQECEELRKQWDFSVAHKIILEKDYNAELNQLKAENDSLKSELMQKNCYLDADKEIIDQLKAECENWKNLCKFADKQIDELEAENETYKKMLEDEDVILALNEVRTGERHLWYNKAQKLSQALTEIKEIAVDFYKTGFVRTDCGATLINNNICLNTLEQILQKCEVLDE